MDFSDLGLSDSVLQAIRDAGYTTPTPIQEQAIPYVLMGRDVLGCAQTGTGKTAGFTLPMIDILGGRRARARMPRCLILEPTRELAAQVGESFTRYGLNSGLTFALLTGGTSLKDQQKALDRGVDVLIATPGRLLDLFDRGQIIMTDVKIMVIDEADRMLDMGFIPDVERIVTMLPPIHQTLLFSATMPKEIRRLAEAFLMNPKEISVAPPATTSATVRQGLVRVAGSEAKVKRAALRRLLAREDVRNALIFCNRKRDVSVVFRSLQRHGFNASELHGDMAQPVRTETLKKFKNEEIVLLVCSDVAQRGLDITGLSHVFNYDVPINPEDYVHRIGRTGRAGREGAAFTLATSHDAKAVAAIEKTIGQAIPLVDLDGDPATAAADKSPAADAIPEPASDPADVAVAKTQAGDGEKPARRRRPRRGRSGSRGGAAEAGSDSDREPQPSTEQASGETAIADDNGTEDPPAPRRERAPAAAGSPFGEHTPAFLTRRAG